MHKLINREELTSPQSFQDMLRIVAADYEDSLVAAGAEPYKDYTALDVYRLSQPFAVEIWKRRKDVLDLLSQ